MASLFSLEAAFAEPTWASDEDTQAAAGTELTAPVLTPSRSHNERDIDSFGYPLKTVDKRELFQPLQKKQYRALTERLEASQKAFEKDFHYENLVRDGFDTFYRADAPLEPLLNEWIVQQPNSYAAYIARAMFFEARGWLRRGGNFADQTSPEQFQGLREDLVRSVQDVEKALQLHPDLVVGYAILIRTAKAVSSPRTARRLLDQGLKISPYSFGLRKVYMFSLLPRWGGSYAAMAIFAGESGRLAKENPKLKVLYGYIYDDLADILKRNKKLSEAIESYSKALSYGILSMHRF